MNWDGFGLRFVADSKATRIGEAAGGEKKRSCSSSSGEGGSWTISAASGGDGMAEKDEPESAEPLGGGFVSVDMVVDGSGRKCWKRRKRSSKGRAEGEHGGVEKVVSVCRRLCET